MTDITPTADTENTVVIDDAITTTEGVQDSHPPVEDPETFPREYVEDLRKENGKYRTRAQQADDLAARLHTALVTATGRLQDPTDLVFDELHLSDSASLTAAVDALLVSKPHLASRKTFGNIGQGPSVVTDTVSLSGLLRSGAN